MLISLLIYYKFLSDYIGVCYQAWTYIGGGSDDVQRLCDVIITSNSWVHPALMPLIRPSLVRGGFYHFPLTLTTAAELKQLVQEQQD